MKRYDVTFRTFPNTTIQHGWRNISFHGLAGAILSSFIPATVQFTILLASLQPYSFWSFLHTFNFTASDHPVSLPLYSFWSLHPCIFTLSPHSYTTVNLHYLLILTLLWLDISPFLHPCSFTLSPHSYTTAGFPKLVSLKAKASKPYLNLYKPTNLSVWMAYKGLHSFGITAILYTYQACKTLLRPSKPTNPSVRMAYKCQISFGKPVLQLYIISFLHPCNFTLSHSYTPVTLHYLIHTPL